MEEWIQNLKKGDLVFIKSISFGINSYNLTSVKNITPKGYIRTIEGSLFNPKNHMKIYGGSFKDNFIIDNPWNNSSLDCDYLVEYNAESKNPLQEAIEFETAIRFLYNFDWKKLSNEKIINIFKIAWSKENNIHKILKEESKWQNAKSVQ